MFLPEYIYETSLFILIFVIHFKKVVGHTWSRGALNNKIFYILQALEPKL